MIFCGTGLPTHSTGLRPDYFFPFDFSGDIFFIYAATWGRKAIPPLLVFINSFFKLRNARNNAKNMGMNKINMIFFETDDTTSSNFKLLPLNFP
jgi:hypothetical protein